jgi:hypothetical protein
VPFPSAAGVVWPAVHAEERFCEIDANTEVSPNFASR